MNKENETETFVPSQKSQNNSIRSGTGLVLLLSLVPSHLAATPARASFSAMALRWM